MSLVSSVWITVHATAELDKAVPAHAGRCDGLVRAQAAGRLFSPPRNEHRSLDNGTAIGVRFKCLMWWPTDLLKYARSMGTNVFRRS